MPHIQVITFDLDDTLWDIMPVLVNAEQQVYNWLTLHYPSLCKKYDRLQLRHRNFEFVQTLPELKHQLTQLRISALAATLAAEGIAAAEALAASNTAFEIFIRARHEVTLFDYTTSLLSSLAKNYRLGVLTNGNADVNRIGLGEYFDFSLSSEQLNASKPQRDHFEAAEKYCNCLPENMLHIGDDPRKDVQAAIDYDWHSIWVNFDNTKWRGRGNPSATVGSLEEIPAAIAAIERPSSA
ncbi:MAG: putative hydrolase of the HAD superfamily [Porticoccus sp.]|jgi:putative hydrolase of the HAD superfamily